MVIDPNNYDVSELREQSETDDTSSSTDDDHGFNWIADEENDQEHDNSQRSQSQSDDANTFQPKNRQQSSEREDEPQHPEPEQSDQQQFTRKNVDSDDSVTRKFFTSQDGGRILPRQDIEEHDTRQTTSQDSHDHTERSDWTTDDREDEDESRRQRPERMRVDPINYDLGELRTITDHEISDSPEPDTEVHGFVWSEPPEQYRTRLEDPTAEQHHRLLTIAGIDPELVGEKPYLTTIPTEAAGAFVTDWLEFLTTEAGTDGAIDAVSYYQDIGWFTERVERDLRNSMLWTDHHDGDGFSVFDRGDHLLSFAYVAKIASINSEGMMFY